MHGSDLEGQSRAAHEGTWKCLLGVVDLGALEGVAGVDVDGLPGGVEVECTEAFAVAVAGLLDAATMIGVGMALFFTFANPFLSAVQSAAG